MNGIFRIGVFFMNFRLGDSPGKLCTDIVLSDRNTHEVFSDKLRFIFIELPAFTNEEEECITDFERWIYVLKNMESKPVLRKAIISICCLLVCYGVSNFGLMWVIQVAYKYLGIFNWIFIILPLWFLGYKNIKKRDKGEKLEV